MAVNTPLKKNGKGGLYSAIKILMVVFILDSAALKSTLYMYVFRTSDSGGLETQ